MGQYFELAEALGFLLHNYFVKPEDNNEPELSIILLTRNNGKTIVDCLSSLLKQTYKNFELIILDNDSSDGTEDVIQILNCDARIKLFNCKEQKLKFNIKEAMKYINTNKVLIVKPGDILGLNDIKILIKNNAIKELSNINHYSKLYKQR